MNTHNPNGKNPDHYFPELLTAEKVADILKVTPQTIGNYIRSGELPAYRIGRSHRIAQKDLHNFLIHNRESQQGSPSPVNTALIFRPKSGAKMLLKTTANFLQKHLSPEQQEGIAIAFDGKEYALADFVAQEKGVWKKRSLQS